jgi:thiol:disulfide interchange protein DsbD
MTMMRKGLIFFRSVLLITLLLAGTVSPLAAQDILQKAKWKIDFSPKKNLEVGDEITLTLAVNLDEGFHVYSAIPPEDMPVLATTFELDESATGIELVGPLRERDGKAESGYDEIFETNITIYHDKVTFFQKARITAPEAKLEGFIRYQVCDASRCVPGNEDVAFAIQAVKKKP